MTTGAFAGTSKKESSNEKKEIKNSSKTTETDKVGTKCCTATLTYNWQYVDHETVCLNEVFIAVACESAKRKVLARHLEAAPYF
jgi:hypothetical protein